MIWKKIILLLLHLEGKKQTKKIGRPNKMNLGEYLDGIYHVLTSGIQWYNLKGDVHWSTYHKKFILWSKKNLFKNSFLLMQKLMKKQGYLNNEGLKNLFIDSSMIKNVKGSDGLGVNHYDRGRKGSKISVIVTENGIPLGIKLTGSNKHDISVVEDLIDEIQIKIIGSKLIGDKGYCSKKLKGKLKNKGIELVYPMKKNSREKNSDEENKLLGKRNIVENFFSWMQNKRHLKLRYDRYQKSYIEFYYLGLMIVISKKITL